MQKVSKNDWKSWLNICDFIKTEVLKYSKYQELSKEMVIGIKELLLYIDSCTEQEITYHELLMLFKQCQFDIKRVIEENSILSDDKKLNMACQIVKNYFDEIWYKETDGESMMQYFNKPCSVSVSHSFNIHAEVYRAFIEKVNEIKKVTNKGKGNWRAFTLTGVINTCIMAFAKGLIEFKNDNGKIYMCCQSGIIGTADECRLSE